MRPDGSTSNFRYTPESRLKAEIGQLPIVRVHRPAHRRCGCWQLTSAWAALQALLADATLAVRFDGKDRANGHAER